MCSRVDSSIRIVLKLPLFSNVLIAWKYLLVYNGLCLKSLDKEEVQIGKLLQLLLMINEVILKENVKEEQVNNFLSANAYFNYYDSTYQMAIRSYYIFIKNKKIYQMLI